MGRNLIIALGILASTSGLSLACQPDKLLDQSYRIRGDATLLDGTLLYSELLDHQSGPQGSRLTVSYAGAAGNRIADKTVDYGCYATTPSYRLVDHASGVVEGVNWDEQRVVTYRDTEISTLPIPEGPSIVDAGFDHAVKLNWDQLISGERVAFNYLFARDGSFLKLRFERSEAPEQIADEARAGTVFFRIAPNNMFIRAIAKPLYVGYDISSRTLRYYIGPSNLPSMRDQKSVIIRYTKLELSPTPQQSGFQLAGAKAGLIIDTGITD